MRVSSGSDPKKLGSALTHRFASGDDVRLRAVGAAAVNNAVKGIAIAQSFAPRGVLLVCSPAFVTAEFHDASISAIELLVTQHRPVEPVERPRPCQQPVGGEAVTPSTPRQRR
jgi:stage V sporulation protein S